MSRMRWTPEADEIVRQGIAEKLSAKEIAARLGPPCKDKSVFSRAHKLGLNFDVAAWRERVGRHARSERTRRLVAEANKRRFAKPGAREEVSARFKRLFADPAYAEANRQKIIAWRATPEGRAQTVAAARKRNEARIGWLPDQFRDEYFALRRKKGAAAARVEIEPKVKAWCQTFEGQLWRVRTGQARLVENVRITRPATAVLTSGCSLTQ